MFYRIQVGTYTGKAMGLFALVLVVVLGTCILPYQFPSANFIKGASYEVGFNNSIAYTWYGLTLWGPALYLARSLFISSELSASFDAAKLFVVPSPILWATLFIHALLFAALYAYKGQFVFAESLYFQTVLYRMTQGEVPYVDFSFYYGPVMLYPGYLLARYLDVEAAYGLYFVFAYLFGLYMLYRAIRAVVPRADVADYWFLLISLGFFNPWTGLNGTFVRCLLPVVAFVLATIHIRSGCTRTLVKASIWLSLCMLYSFDTGAVTIVGILLLVVVGLNHHALIRILRWLIDTEGAETGKHASIPYYEGRWFDSLGWVHLISRVGILLGLGFLVSVGMFIAIDPSLHALKSYPEIALSYSAGAHNLPIYPNLPFLTIVALTIVGCAGLLSAVSRGNLRGQEDLAFGYLLLVLLMERGAFGSAEPTHFAYYALPLILLCVFLAYWVERWEKVRKYLALTLALGLIFPLQYYHATLFLPFINKHLGAVRTHVYDNSEVTTASPRESIQNTLVAMVKQIGRDKSYLMLQLDYYSFPVYRNLQLQYPTFFTFLSNARTYQDIDKVIKQLKMSKTVILARENDLLPTVLPEDNDNGENLWDVLSGAHTSGSRLARIIQRNERRLYIPLIEFIASNYERTLALDGIVALVPKEN